MRQTAATSAYPRLRGGIGKVENIEKIGRQAAFFSDVVAAMSARKTGDSSRECHACAELSAL